MSKRKVTNKDNDFSYEAYMSDERWSSYFRQIDEVREIEKAEKKDLNVLVIGVGDGLIPQLIKFFCHCRVITFDYDRELQPDIVGDIFDLSKYVTKCFDVILCCQVLEHIPYIEFQKALEEIWTCLEDGGKCIISLPDSGYDLGGGIETSIWGAFKIFRFCKYWKKDYIYNGEHYWEINAARVYSLKKVIKVIKRSFVIEKNYLVPNNRYHRFFVLSKDTIPNRFTDT